MSNRNPGIIPTKAMLAKTKSTVEDFEVVVFEGKKKKIKPAQPIPRQINNKIRNISESSIESDNDDDDLDDIFSNKRTKKLKKDDDNIFNLKRARKEVINYGIAGMEKDKKIDAQIALAIKLGAKPPKSKYVNYKEWKAEKKIATQSAGVAVDSKKQFVPGNYGATQSYLNSKQKRKQKTVVSGDVLKHYGVANPKIGKKKK